ncbi:class I SAM-dependent methyltransferase [Myxococcota bacterium]|nr:class I SAM-dependent methyltransferase [Myxococcota bacterium]
MAKTGHADKHGTAEDALISRVAHALHAESPLIDESNSLPLLRPEDREVVVSGELYRQRCDPSTSPIAPILAGGLASLRFAEDVAHACFQRSVGQSVCLGAGFDTFAFRQREANPEVVFFEVDHPDVQALKRERFDEVGVPDSRRPVFVAVDFETMSLIDALDGAGFDPGALAVFSWMNTLPYLTREATESTLTQLASRTTSSSTLVVNYASDLPYSEAQQKVAHTLAQVTGERREPLRSQWTPEEFETLLERTGFEVVEHLDEQDLMARYFSDRSDGLAPGLPARVVNARRRAS